jgi:hypothetical protein
MAGPMGEGRGALLSLFIFFIQPLKMDLTEGSETSAKLNLTPGKYPNENIQVSEHGENLKSRFPNCSAKLVTFNLYDAV